MAEKQYTPSMVTPSGERRYYRDEEAVHDVDSALDSSSTNPVENRAIATELAKKADLKKAADVSGMGNDDTHAYSGEAVSMAISSAVSGNVGGFLGDMTVAQLNAYTTPKMGDNAIVTDTGTITVGSEQCVISAAPTEVRWTTSGSWKVSSAGYVRDTQIATDSAPGVVKTNSANGGVSLNSGNQMVVNGWNDKQDVLPYCESSHSYEIDIAGSATSIRGGTPAYYSTNALFIPIQANAPSGTNWAGIFNDALDRLANKGRVIAYYSGAKTSSTTYEKYVPAAYVYRSRSAAGTIEEIHFTEVLDDLHDTTAEKYHGLIREYTLKPSGWESISGTTHWPYYAEKAGDANTAVNAANDVNGVPITITKNSGGLISAIGAALIHASKADTDANGLSLTLTVNSNGRVNAIGNRSIYAAEAGEAVSAYKDDNRNVIHEYYGRKQLYQWLGSSGTIGLTTGSTNVLWLEDRLGVDEYKPEHKPEVHFFTVDINFIGIDISGFSSVGASLKLYTTAREGVETVQDIFLGESVIVVPAGNSSHHIVIPFQNSTPYVKFRPRLAVQFQLPLKNGVTQQCFFSRWYTSLAY